MQRTNLLRQSRYHRPLPVPITLHTRGILFDMDGVLISSTAADERCWTRWAKLRGMKSTFSIQSTHGRRAVDTLHILRPDLDPATEVALLEDFDAEDHSGILIFPGVQPLLASLPPDRWTIVTSASLRLMENRLSHVGLPRPRTIITAARVANGKPHPEPYLAGAASLGLSPADCLVIEDAPTGVQSGKAAGCQVIGVLNSHSPSELVAADYLVDSLAQITAILTPQDTLEIRLNITTTT